MQISMFGGASSQPINPNYTYEMFGWSTGGGTDTTSGSANGLGSFTQLSASTANAWNGFILQAAIGASTSSRYLIDVFTDGGVGTALITSLFAEPSTSGGYATFRVPLIVAAGSNFGVKLRAAGASQHLFIAGAGIVANANAPPGFSNYAHMTSPDTTNTKVSTKSVNLTTGASTWTSIEDTTAHNYGAFLLTVEENATPTGSIRGVHATLADGPSGGGSEVAFGGGGFVLNPSNPMAPRATVPLIEHGVSSGGRISANLQSVDAGAPDTFFVGVIGFY